MQLYIRILCFASIQDNVPNGTGPTKVGIANQFMLNLEALSLMVFHLNIKSQAILQNKLLRCGQHSHEVHHPMFGVQTL